MKESDNTRLLQAIDAAADDAYGSDKDGDLEADRARAIDLYLGKNLEPAPEGRSQVVDRSVFETVQWILPSLCRIFANGDDVVELPPVGPEDEEGAKQEAQYLNHVIQQKNPWFEIFLTWATDAMLTKNAYCMAYQEEKVCVEYDEYKRQTEEGLAMLLDGDIEVVEHSVYPDPDYKEPQPQQAMDPMTGHPVMIPPPPAPMLYDVKLRKKTPEKKICLRVLPPERCLVSKDVTSYRLGECPYFEFYDLVTISDLRRLGYDVEDDIAQDEDTDSEEDSARDLFSENTGTDEDNPVDPAMRKVKARYIWIAHDNDEDGIAEMQFVLRVGQEILARYEVSRVHVASIGVIPLPHRHPSLSISDITEDLQRIKTAILRGGLDNLYLSNNPQKVVNIHQVNLDDLLVSRPGGLVRVDGDVHTASREMVTPFVFPQAMEGLEYMDQVRENRTGTNRYFTGIDQNAMNKTATGIQQLSTMAAQRVEQIARIIATGVQDLFSIVHELILKGGHKKESVQLRGKWVEVDPAAWRKRTDFRISVGYAAGNKDAMMQKLMLILQAQREALVIGVAQPKNVYEALIELTKAADFATPERFWTDPAKAPPQPPAPDPMIEAEKIKSETTLKKTEAELAVEQRTNAESLMLEKYKADLDAEVKLKIEQFKAQHQAQLEHDRMQHEGSLEGFRAERSAEADDKKLFADEATKKVNEDRKKRETELKSKADLADVLEKQAEQMQGTIKLLASAKRRVNRGKDGKAASIDILDDDGSVISTRNVVRGRDGRIEGTA